MFSKRALHISTVVMFIISLMLNVQTSVACQMRMAQGADAVATADSAGLHRHHSQTESEAMMHHLGGVDVCCDPLNPASQLLTDVDPADCCKDTAQVNLMGASPDDEAPEPQLSSPAFEWLAPVFYIVAIMQVPEAPATIPWFTTESAAHAAAAVPVFKATERFRL